MLGIRKGRLYREDLEKFDKIHFSGCTHFCCEGVIHHEKWRKEKYKNEVNMTDELIVEWNSKVGWNDLVIHLGDFGFEGKEEEMFEVVRQLNGTLLLIRGNHDTDAFLNGLERLNNVYVADDFGVVLRYEDKNLEMFLTHYPVMLDWSERRVSVHSHIHGKQPLFNYMFNVAMDYTREVVTSEEELINRIEGYRSHLTREKMLEYYDKYRLQPLTIDKETYER